MSDTKSITVREFTVPVTVDGAYEALNEISTEIKRLDSLKKKIRKYLCDNIPVESVDEKHAEGEVNGIIRSQFAQLRTSYSDAMREIVDELVPKTRLGDVKDIVEKHTKVVLIDKFKVADYEEGFDE